MKATPQNTFPPAAERLLRILDCFLEEDAVVKPKELAKRLDIPLSSLYRILNCLEEYQYITENPKQTNTYIPGYKLNLFGRQFSAEQQLIQIAKPYIQETVNETGQASQLCVLTSRGVCIIDQCIPSFGITLIGKLGAEIPINISAGGKMLVSLLPASQQSAFLRRSAKTLRPQTEFSITTVEAMKAELKQVRRQNYATDIQEYAIGIGCLAVPIMRGQKAIAALGITGSIEHYKDPDQIKSFLDTLYRNAAMIEKSVPSIVSSEGVSFITNN